ncbi:hypothetical protein EG850_11200 [Gulosibacter macacae]|uniref:Uncharacterized protein n=1 Tax=Gulosibacter macacae TaxID=2488791 RepID=A0A3P3VT52_9MICO|nr:hypothetical protein [Gulosibacter macacae]RRJ85945.1 hypothetical protein EG850_11200 [Gulosibacter macacae]
MTRKITSISGTRASWFGILDGYPRGVAVRTLVAPLHVATDSGAGCFFGLLDDGSEVWVKLPGNPQGTQVLVNETVIGGFSTLIAGPTPHRELVNVDADLINSWSGRPLWGDRYMHLDGPVIGHASTHIELVTEHPAEAFQYPKRDDNERRQAHLAALWDLFLGGDPQWLYQHPRDHSIWSHDHGFWMYTQESDWTECDLFQLVGVDNQWADLSALDPDSLETAALELESITHKQVLDVIAQVPACWGTPNRDLEALGWFITTRIPDVASRLRNGATHASRQVHGRK